MNSTQKGITAFMLCSCLALAGAAYASTYTTTFAYSRGVLGVVRTYSGANIRASLTPHSIPVQTSYLRLYRVTDGPLGTKIFRLVAQPTFNSSYTGATVVRSYPGVGRGSYAFELEKIDAQKNSVLVTGTITMYNY